MQRYNFLSFRIALNRIFLPFLFIENSNIGMAETCFVLATEVCLKYFCTLWYVTQSFFTCSKSALETPEQFVKPVQS